MTSSTTTRRPASAIAGPMERKRLHSIASLRTRWPRWLNKHPQTNVLSADTGYDRNYAVDSYEGCARAFRRVFPVGDGRTDLDAKARVLGVVSNGAVKNYTLSVWEGRGVALHDQVGGTSIQITASADSQFVEVLNERSRALSAIFAC